MVNASLTAGDIALLRDIVDLAQLHAGDPPVETTFDVLGLLQRLVGCDIVSFQAMDTDTLARWHQQDVEDGSRELFGPEDPAAVQALPDYAVAVSSWWTSMCSLIERTGAPVVVSAHAQPELPRNRYLQELMPVVDELLVGHPVGALRSLRIIMPRTEGRPFGERELLLMRLLHPHLKPLLEAAATGRTGRSPALTPRQVEILRLVKLGMPNKRIARVLGISEGTVRKHLEHTYERLGVQSRVAAVTRALDADENAITG